MMSGLRIQLPQLIEGVGEIPQTKSVYLEQYKDLVNDIIKEETSKRVIKSLTATRKVMTCSIRKLQTKLFKMHNISASLRTIYNLKPFYISFPTEKEKI